MILWIPNSNWQYGRHIHTYAHTHTRLHCTLPQGNIIFKENAHIATTAKVCYETSSPLLTLLTNA